MKKTDRKPGGEMATNLTPQPITDRPEQSYQKRSWIDKIIIAVVVLLAAVVIYLSFGNTAKLAILLALNPHLAACLVEMLFGSLLFIRARQRALQRNVPFFLDIGYFTSLAFVTLVNMWGLGRIDPTGYVVGAAVTGAMWLMENTLVWLWTDSHRPHKKSVREMKREVRKEIKIVKGLQQIEWEKSEAQKPDLDLINKARKAERKREKVVRKGLPYFFRTGQTIQTEQTDAEQQTPNKQTPHVKQTAGQTNAQQTPDNQTEQTRHQTNRQTVGQTNKTLKQTEQTNEQTDNRANKQTPNKQTNGQTETEHQTDKQNPNNQTEQTEQNKQTNIKRTPNKQDDNEHTNQTPDKANKQTDGANKQAPDKQTDTKQTTQPKQTERVTEQTDKQSKQTKQTNKVIYIKRTNKKPTYEELVETLDQIFKETKKLPSVRVFAEQANVKENRSYEAIKMWRKANGWKEKKKTKKTANK